MVENRAPKLGLLLPLMQHSLQIDIVDYLSKHLKICDFDRFETSRLLDKRLGRAVPEIGYCRDAVLGCHISQEVLYHGYSLEAAWKSLEHIAGMT